MAANDALTVHSAPTPAGGQVPMLVRLVHRLESARSLDRAGDVVDALSRPTGAPAVAALLRGEHSGHALHPFLTDIPIGMWSASLLLDLLGRESDRPAAKRLMGVGLLSAVPTVVTGLAEWRTTKRPESRVATVHAALNGLAFVMYAASWDARRRSQRTGVVLSLGATTVASLAGFLGGHLVVARKVGSRNAAYQHDGVGPQVTRPAPSVHLTPADGGLDPA
jgi:uncharacterized membrane protein